MKHFKILGLFSILYFFSLALLFGISKVENETLLIFSVLLYIETVVMFSVYYAFKQSAVNSIAILLSLSFITYFIHLLVTLPFSLMYVADDLVYATFQKSLLTSIRVIINLQLYTFISLTIYLLLKKEHIKFIKSFFLFGLTLLIAFVIPVELFNVKIVYLLNSFLPMFLIFLLLAHLLLLQTKNDINNVMSSYLTVTFFLLALWSIIGYAYGLVLYFDRWEFFDIATLYSLKGYEAIEGLPRSWWIPISEHTIFRFPSTFENPITASYFAAFMSMIAFALRHYLLSMLFFLFALISISKGAILFLLLTLAVILFSKTSLIGRMLLLKILDSSLILALMLLGYIALQFTLSDLFKSSASIHLLGLTLPFSNINQYSVTELLFGHGIGSGGNFFKSAYGSGLDSTTWLQSGSESGIGTVFYQLGTIGLSMLVLIHHKIIFLLQTIEARFIFFFYFVSMFLQENLINFNLLILLFFAVIIIELNRKQKDFTYVHTK